MRPVVPTLTSQLTSLGAWPRGRAPLRGVTQFCMGRCASGPSPEARQRTFPSAGLHSRSRPVITKRDSSFPPTPVLGNSRGPFRRRSTCHGSDCCQFIQKTLAAAATITIAGTKSSGRVLGANETIRVAVAGLNGRGASHVCAYVGMPNVQISRPRSIRSNPRSLPRCSRTIQQRTPTPPPQDGGRHSPSPRRPQSRRRLYRHAEPLARGHDDLGGPGRQARLRRKADEPQREGRPHRRRHRSPPQRHRPARHPEPLGCPLAAGRRDSSTPASSVVCSYRAAWGLPNARRQASLGPAFPTRQCDDRSPPASTSTSGPGPAPMRALPREPGSLPLALVLGLRQRRHRQPGRSPNGHRSLGHPQRHVAAQRRLRRRPFR